MLRSHGAVRWRLAVRERSISTRTFRGFSPKSSNSCRILCRRPAQQAAAVLSLQSEQHAALSLPFRMQDFASLPPQQDFAPSPVQHEATSLPAAPLSA